METIFYLKMQEEKKTPEKIPPLFHFIPGRALSGKEWPAEWESPRLVGVELPRARMDPWELAEYIKPFWQRAAEAAAVYDPSVEVWLRERKIAGWWQQFFPYPRYRHFRKKEYGQLLIAGAKNRIEQMQGLSILVLGYDESISDLLKPFLRTAGELRLFPESAEAAEKMENYAESVYEEYGLAIAVKDVPRRLVQKHIPFYAEKSLILDFSGENIWYPAKAVPGSIWLDMDSIWEKRKRIETRYAEIAYDSLQKHLEKLFTT